MASKCDRILLLLQTGPHTVLQINDALKCKDASARCAELFKRGKIIDVEPTRNRRVWGLATQYNKCHAAVQEGMQEVRRSQEADLLNGPVEVSMPGDGPTEVKFGGLKESLAPKGCALGDLQRKALKKFKGAETEGVFVDGPPEGCDPRDSLNSRRPKEWHIVVRDGGPFGEMGTAYRTKKIARQAATNVKGQVITTREV